MTQMIAWERTASKSTRDQVKYLRECGLDNKVKETMLEHYNYVTEYPLASWKDLIKKLQ